MSAPVPPGGSRRRRFGRAKEPPAPPPAPRVLLVDDVESLRALLRSALEPGFAVVGEAADGREAVRAAAELQPDAVVLDLNMPRHDGLEAIGGILAASPGARIVVLSALPPELLADKALALGAHRYVDKADTLDALLAALREVLS